jgi:PKD repeat protein
VPPIANFSATPTSGNAPLRIAFTDTSTGSSTSWIWNFGDGTPNSLERNLVHTYNKAVRYTVRLTVTNSRGSNTAVRAGYITVNK